ncbi:MAG: hypothetical protein JNM12_13210 [Alphaproteobacteria bacterium]|nr:hypothetical protein [Alphaproteobacteria bacterium]
MKESEIKTKFDAASQAFAKRLEDTYAGTYLAALQGAVKELQEGGMNISLETRLRKNGSAVPRADVPVVNATTVVDGHALEWIILSTFNKSSLIAYDAGGQVTNFESERKSWTGPWSAPPTDGAVSLKDAIMTVIIENFAQAKAAAAFSVPATGISGTLDKKPIAPPKLGIANP